MTGGGVRRRCRCRDENGKDLGSRCPKLAQRSHGSWQVRQELPAGPGGKRRTWRRLGYATQAAARADLDRVRALLALGRDEDDADTIGTMLVSLTGKAPLPDVETVRRRLRAGQGLVERMTVGEWLQRWLAQESHRRATEVSYESHVRLYFTPRIGHVRLDRLTVGHLAEMFQAIEAQNAAIEANNAARRSLERQVKNTGVRAQKRALREQLAALAPYRRPVGPSSRQRIRATLRAALNDAITAQLLTFNPAEHLELETRRPRPLVWTAERVAEWRRTGLRPSTVMVWTPAHAGAFLDYVAEHDQDREALWHVMLLRGPRRGEVAGLRWVDTDLDAGTVHIATQLTEVEYAVQEDDPKTAAGVRPVPLDSESVRLLRVHRRRQLAERLRLGGAWVDSGRVFTAADGSPLRPSWIGDQFGRLTAAAGLPPIRLHDLRHTAATLMLAAGVDLKVVQETLGHSALSTTSDLYTSVLPELAAAAAEATVAVVPRSRTSGHPVGTQPTAASGPDGEVVARRTKNRS